MKNLICMFLALSISAQALADPVNLTPVVPPTCPNAVVLHVGDTVKDCDRVALSVPYNKSVEKQLVDGDFNKKIVDQQAQIITYKDQTIQATSDQAKIWKDASDANADALEKEKNKANLGFWGGMAAGFLMTVGSAYVVSKAVK